MSTPPLNPPFPNEPSDHGQQPYPAAGQPVGQPGPGSDGAILGTIGDISYDATTVYVPGRSFPIKDSIWTMRDMSRIERTIPAWAIVCAIVFALMCLIGLLFLLVKEERYVGYAEVEVRNGRDYHVAQIPVTSAATLPWVSQTVNHARSVAAWASS